MSSEDNLKDKKDRPVKRAKYVAKSLTGNLSGVTGQFK
jgi:hypothetical protein